MPPAITKKDEAVAEVNSATEEQATPLIAKDVLTELATLETAAIESLELPRIQTLLLHAKSLSAPDATRQIAAQDIELVQWNLAVISAIAAAKEKGEQTNCLSFTHNNFPPEHIDLYLDLQTHIASLVPNEYERPTITLHVRGKHRQSTLTNNPSNIPDIALLGGTGPLSDANIMCQLIKQRQETGVSLEDVYLLLTSAPPPRAEERSAEPLNYAKHFLRYLSTVYNFVRTEFNQLVILSNTAHKNAGTLMRMMTHPERFLHLVDSVAQALKKQQYGKVHKVLVLGTTEAAEANLYPNFLTGIPSELPEIDLQHQLQLMIDETKSGRANKIGHLFIELVLTELQRTRASHVLLSCTEIPLLLQTTDPSSSSVKRTFHDLLLSRIEEKFPGTKITLVDTEHKMVETILEHQAAAISTKISPESIDLTCYTPEITASFLQVLLQDALREYYQRREQVRATSARALLLFSSASENTSDSLLKTLETEILASKISLPQLQYLLTNFFQHYQPSSKILDHSPRATILETLLKRSLTADEREYYAGLIINRQCHIFIQEVLIAVHKAIKKPAEVKAPAYTA